MPVLLIIGKVFAKVSVMKGLGVEAQSLRLSRDGPFIKAQLGRLSHDGSVTMAQ